MAENASRNAKQESHEENMPNQRITRRQVEYSLMAVMAALVVFAFEFVFTFQSIADGGSSHVHAAESESLSHGDGAVDDVGMEMTSSGETQAELALDDDTEHVPHEEASDDHGHSTDE